MKIGISLKHIKRLSGVLIEAVAYFLLIGKHQRLNTRQFACMKANLLLLLLPPETAVRMRAKSCRLH